MPADLLDEMKGPRPLRAFDPPEEYGGGLDSLHGGRVPGGGGTGADQSPAFRSAFGTNVGIGSQGLVMFGTDDQKQKYLPGIASGEIITSFALTEPEAGSDSANVQTRAILDGDHYVLNGSKRFITNANKADLFTVMARSDPEKPGAGGVSAFLVERNLPGLSVGKPEKKMGQQGAHICDVIFDNVRGAGGQSAGPGGRGLQGRHAGAGPRALTHLGGLRRRRRAADQGLRGLYVRAPAVLASHCRASSCCKA